MTKIWRCPDCGKEYDLDKERADLAKVSSWKLSQLGPNRCRGILVKGKHYHFNGIAGRFYKLSPKGEQAITRISLLLASVKRKPIRASGRIATGELAQLHELESLGLVQSRFIHSGKKTITRQFSITRQGLGALVKLTKL